MEYVPVVGIAIVLFALAEVLKRTIFKNNEDLKAVLPYVCALVGAAAGAVCYIVDPILIPGATNILGAIVAGAVSGLIATGAHQIYKQFVKLMTVARSTSKDIEEEVNTMTSDEKKEYLTDVAADMLTDVLNKTNGVEETDTGHSVKDPTTSEPSDTVSDDTADSANEDSTSKTV